MVQGTLAATAFLTIAFAPPEVGRTLLIPLDGQPIREALLEQDALTRLAPGPLPGSIMVEGRGRMLASALLDQGILVLAAPAAICGEASQGARRNG